MKRFTATWIVMLALCATLVVGMAPGCAVATPSGPVPSHAMVSGLSLFGLSYSAARAAIVASMPVPPLAPITVKARGHIVKKLWLKSAVVLNADATLAQAYSAVDTVTVYNLAPVLAAKSNVISGWTNSIAGKVHRSSKNAYRSVKNKRLVFHAEIVGYQVNKKKTTDLLSKIVAAEMASPHLAPRTVYAPMITLHPDVTRANIPKAILIVLSQFRIKLYNHDKLEKSYPCAIGMLKYPTPTGHFKVTRKVKNPTWYNPGSAWAKNMPPVIHGGPNSPLGTRAIYTSAPGIRMHGVPASENWSIGHRASHGCLRMHRKDVEDLYPRVQVGIPVWIIN
jgi:lipoprotein-anchoring transpeptidase ErfK/SrfK